MYTIIRPAEGSLSVRRSRFLGYVWPVETCSDVHRELRELSGRYHDARHVAHAFRLHKTGEERAHDDGEPPGTAGTAMLQLLCGEDLWNVAVAVVRYFGGVKLGVGNLARAYREATRVALEQAGRRRLVPMTRAVVEAPQDLLGAVFAEIGRRGLRVVGQRVAERAEVDLVVPEEELETLRRALAPWAQIRREED